MVSWAFALMRSTLAPPGRTFPRAQGAILEWPYAALRMIVVGIARGNKPQGGEARLGAKRRKKEDQPVPMGLVEPFQPSPLLRKRERGQVKKKKMMAKSESPYGMISHYSQNDETNFLGDVRAERAQPFPFRSHSGLETFMQGALGSEAARYQHFKDQLREYAEIEIFAGHVLHERPLHRQILILISGTCRG